MSAPPWTARFLLSPLWCLLELQKLVLWWNRHVGLRGSAVLAYKNCRNTILIQIFQYQYIESSCCLVQKERLLSKTVNFQELSCLLFFPLENYCSIALVSVLCSSSVMLPWPTSVHHKQQSAPLDLQSTDSLVYRHRQSKSIRHSNLLLWQLCEADVTHAQVEDAFTQKWSLNPCMEMA